MSVLGTTSKRQLDAVLSCGDADHLAEDVDRQCPRIARRSDREIAPAGVRDRLPPNPRSCVTTREERTP